MLYTTCLICLGIDYLMKLPPIVGLESRFYQAGLTDFVKDLWVWLCRTHKIVLFNFNLIHVLMPHGVGELVLSAECELTTQPTKTDILLWRLRVTKANIWWHLIYIVFYLCLSSSALHYMIKDWLINKVTTHSRSWIKILSGRTHWFREGDRKSVV